MIKLKDILKEVGQAEEIFVTGLVNGLETLRGTAPQGFKDRRNFYPPSGQQVFYTEDIVGDKKVFSIVDRSTIDAFGRSGFISVSIAVDKDSPITLDSVKLKLTILHNRVKNAAIDKYSGAVDKYKLQSVDLNN